MSKTLAITTLTVLMVSLLFSTNNNEPFKFVTKTQFEEKSKLEYNPTSFCVTEDELVLIPDYRTGFVKIFQKVLENNEQVLKLVLPFGRKGYGFDEFARPYYCFYDQKKSIFGVMDSRLKKFFIYDRLGKTDFKKINEFNCTAEGYNMKLGGDGENVIISGYSKDENGSPFDLLSININTAKKTFLLPSWEKYGRSDKEEYKNDYKNNNIPAIGIMAFFDIEGDFVYFAWEGDLRVIKINLNTLEHEVFGKKTKLYKKPVATENLVKYYVGNNASGVQLERSRFSYIRSVFVSEGNLFLLYEGPQQIVKLQKYNLTGEFLNESSISSVPYTKQCFVKQSNKMYSLGLDKKTRQPKMLIHQVLTKRKR